MKVSIIGCGLIGKKRALAIKDTDDILFLYDIDKKAAEKLSQEIKAKVANSIDEVFNSDSEVIIIATTHNKLAEISINALKNGKNILVEKPGGCNLEEIEDIKKVSVEVNKLVKIGFNHRFHPAFQKAKELALGLNTGKLMFIKASYGHGGRLNYEKEWRMNKSISGGGELLDQGSHLMDLAAWFMGELKLEYANLPTYFWDTDVEDNCFLALSNDTNNLAWLNASWTEWKNSFLFEIYYEKIKLKIDGLGGSYGKESLSCYTMSPSMEPPAIETWDFESTDISWEDEFKSFKDSIQYGKPICGSINDALNAMKLIDTIYKK